MSILIKPILAKAIAPVSAVILVSFVCLGSILYVNEANPSLRENNRWQKLDQEESSFSDIKKAIAAKSLPDQAKPRARALASTYRQQGKQDEAAEIYRMLWLSSPNSPYFALDARELASTYTDMGAYASAVESYQKILQYDRERLPQSAPAIACDLNNLGQCYYTAGCGTVDAKLRRQYFAWAREQFGLAEKIVGRSKSLERDKVDQSIIQLNQALVKMDLDNSQSNKRTEQSAMANFGDFSRTK